MASKRLNINFDVMATKVLNDIGGVLVKQAKENMAEISYGRVYIIGGKAHIASKPGESANNMTGALSKTIRYETRGRIMEYGAGNGAINYAKPLEVGMNRPNINKVLMQKTVEIEARVKRYFIESLRLI